VIVNLRQTVKLSLSLLNRRDRRILILVAIAQMSTAFLDLLGVLLIGVVTALSISVVSEAAIPLFIESVMDRVGLADANIITLASILAGTASTLLVAKSIINLLLTRRVLRFLANRQAMVSGRLIEGLLSRPLLQVLQRSSQETVYALTSGVGFATLTILGQGVVAVAEITLLVVLAVGLLIVSPVVTGFAIAFFLLVALVLQRVLSGWAGRLGLRSSDLEVASSSSIQEALRTYREVVVANRRGLYVNRFQSLRWQAARVQSDLTFISQVPKYVFEVALIVGAGLLAASQLLTKDLTAAVAIIAVFLAAGSRVVPSMLRLQSAAITVRTASGQAAPTFSLAQELNMNAHTSASAGAIGFTDPAVIGEQLLKAHTDFEPRISVSGAWLIYPGSSVPALTGVSFELAPGASLALVGPTGAGKSTLADVILGVLDSDGGSVLIGGLSPAEAIAHWPGALAYVPQDVAMANGTIRENVALGLPRAAINDDWVWEALGRAHLADFLIDSREGLDTVIGEHGMKLSGGQRQRLGVARALYTHPKLLVLDEATSALDAETEQAIAKTLQELEGTVTTVTIAHRLATIRHCDLVVYMENGAIVASGSFDEVRRVSEHFDRQAQLLGL
jgi:ABC-type multidrug transport system fused ATPase/permease subunit